MDMKAVGQRPLEAQKQFGNTTLLCEISHDAWGWRWLEDLVQDVRFTFRTLRRNRGFAAIAVLTLALGIGANISLFSVLYGTCLAPPPYSEPDRLVDVSMLQVTGRQFEAGTSLPNLHDWKQASRSFAGLAVSRPEFHVNLTGFGEAEEAHAWRLSSELLPLIGVQPIVGRGFTAEEDSAGGPRSALLSYGLWHSRFGSRSDVLGRRIFVNGEGHVIVGVMPPQFRYPPSIGTGNPVIWLSLNLPDETAGARETHSLYVTGRLRDGVSIRESHAEMDALARWLASAYPKENGEWPAIRIAPLSERSIREFRSVLWMLSGAAGVVLLIACANVAGLLLARGAARERELAIRRALGVPRGRLVRQLLTESLVLAAAGACAGVLLAHWSLPLLKALLEGRPRVDEIAIRPAVLAFATALAALTGIGFGLAPALHPASGLHAASSHPPLRRALVAMEVGLALVLLTGAGLLIESFWRATSVNLGFRPEHVLTMRVNLAKRKYDTGYKIEAFREEALRRVAALPGVEFAGTNSAPPMNIISANTGIAIEGAAAGQPATDADYGNVSAGYLQAMGIPLRRGRHFQQTDRRGSMRVAILSESLARSCFGGEEPLGKRVRVKRIDGEWFTVVGVAGDVRRDRPEGGPAATVYVLSAQLPESAQGDRASRVIVVAMRTAGEARTLASAARAAVAEIDRDQPVVDIVPMSQLVKRSLADRRLNTLLLGLFAALAVGLAAVGVFGLVSYSVARRTHEIGIRLALGARRSTILGMITRETLTLGGAGTIGGIACSLAASRLLVGMLYGVKPAAPHILIGAAGFLITAVLAATLLAARRAMRVDPVVALRHE
ncbi:MAG: ABC transporter permease [Thermoguttaceae bacterium]|nr:ABC transporter permease [Thermoguttaceae bacterium]